MRNLPSDSIDLIATDPPYGIAFMGKAWDRAIPSVDIWHECLRVLKPGAFAFVMCIPRQDCLARMIISLEDAGFNVSFTSIYWAYASGFPKAQNIGKAVDKRLPRQGLFIPFAKHYADCRKIKGLTHAQICEVGKFYDKYNHGGASVNWEQGHNVPTLGQWRILQPLLGLSLEFLPLIERIEAEREVIEKRRIRRNSSSWETKNGMLATGEQIFDITAPATPQAQALDGSYGGFQPKPAVEVILVAMKPLSEKIYVDQALRNGKGITWLDDGRIPYRGEDIGKRPPSTKRESGIFLNTLNYLPSNQGRFPANLLVSDDALNDGKIMKSSKLGKNCKSTGGFNNQMTFGKSGMTRDYPDSGSFSRYFSLDAWFEKKLTELPKGVQRTFPFLIVPKASKAEKNKGCEKNNHPTCKPIKLISYLITLGSREGDVILDPFVGSGTTAIAARMLRRYYIGYEIDSEYCKIAEARLRVVQERLI